jgi:hypothetical protein
MRAALLMLVVAGCGDRTVFVESDPCAGEASCFPVHLESSLPAVTRLHLDLEGEYQGSMDLDLGGARLPISIGIVHPVGTRFLDLSVLAFDGEALVGGGSSRSVDTFFYGGLRLGLRALERPDCDDDIKDGDEVHIDCGGSCRGCWEGQSCTAPADCYSGICQNDVCWPEPTCNDQLRNQGEYGVDCGGPCSAKCPPSSFCVVDADCEEGFCEDGTCRGKPICGDSIQQWLEADIDCGGICYLGCPPGRKCEGHSDCDSRVCLGGVCQSPTCSDGVKNGNEVDRDCGGPSCAACNFAGQSCTTTTCGPDFTCSSDRRCVPKSCGNAIQDLDEPDLNCGGPCAPCDVGKRCFGDPDCRTKHCEDGVCAVGTCSDGRKNGYEADVDCGDLGCPDCPDGAQCKTSFDCSSNNCMDGRCIATSCTGCGGSTCPLCGYHERCQKHEDCKTGACTNGRCAPTRCDDGARNGDETGVDCGGPCGACP